MKPLMLFSSFESHLQHQAVIYHAHTCHTSRHHVHSPRNRLQFIVNLHKKKRRMLPGAKVYNNVKILFHLIMINNGIA